MHKLFGGFGVLGKLLVLFVILTIAPSYLFAGVVIVNSSISTSTTWTADNIYRVQGNRAVNSGVTLTINSGTVVKFDSTARLNIAGTLNANGTSSPIIFTSIKDDYAGGYHDTGGDGTTTPAKGDWREIMVSSGGTANLHNAEVRFASQSGSGYSRANLYNSGGTLTVSSSTIASSTIYNIYHNSGTTTVTDSTISDATSVGVYVNNGSVSISTTTISKNSTGVNYQGSATTTLTNNQFTQNTSIGLQIEGLGNITFHNNNFVGGNYGVYINPYQGASFTNSSTTASGSSRNGIFILGTVNEDLTLIKDTIPYIFSTLTISSGNTLTLSPGVIVKFLDGFSGITVNGTLNANGTSATSTYFTSIKDDLVGGDTNGNSTSTSPAVGDWCKIKINSGGSAVFNYSIVRYGGYATGVNCTNEYMIHNNGGSLTFATSTASFSKSMGIVNSSGTTTVTASDIAHNEDYGYYHTGGHSTVSGNNTISNNLDYGIYNSVSTFTLDARNNNWGTSTGPGTTTNMVSSYVNADPWNQNDHYLQEEGNDSVFLQEIEYSTSTIYISELDNAITTWNNLGIIEINPQHGSTDLIIQDLTEEDGEDEAYKGLWRKLDGPDLIILNRYYLQHNTSTEIQNTITHELGHALGLAHSYLGNVMVFYQTNRIQLGPQDVSDYYEQW